MPFYSAPPGFEVQLMLTEVLIHSCDRKFSCSEMLRAWPMSMESAQTKRRMYPHSITQEHTQLLFVPLFLLLFISYFVSGLSAKLLSEPSSFGLRMYGSSLPGHCQCFGVRFRRRLTNIILILMCDYFISRVCTERDQGVR